MEWKPFIYTCGKGTKVADSIAFLCIYGNQSSFVICISLHFFYIPDLKGYLDLVSEDTEKRMDPSDPDKDKEPESSDDSDEEE